MRRQRDLLQVVDALHAAGASRAAWTAGSKSAIGTLMIEMATRTSISVKPRRDARRGVRFDIVRSFHQVPC